MSKPSDNSTIYSDSDSDVIELSQDKQLKSQIWRLQDITNQEVGGKAKGLSDLIKLGLSVPSGFVVQHARIGALPHNLKDYYHAIGGGKVAVRSSAIGEDSADASFAGQYETILNVEGIDALEMAIEECLGSLANQRATTYKSQQTDLPIVEMAVVVQCMVEARAAGVLFTVDPVTNRRNHIVIDAVAGLGDVLVSGDATPDHYIVDRKGKLISRDLVGKQAIISEEEIEALRSDALAAEKRQGEHLDMEWAIDQSGKLFWLQARPITTLAADINELDTSLINDDDIVTICNISEALPGAVTPLTFSVTGRGLEVGMQDIQIATGLWKSRSNKTHFIPMLHGRLFINMTQMAKVSADALGSDAKDIALSICGRIIPELKITTQGNFISRLPYIIGYIKLLFSANYHKRRLKQQIAEINIALKDTAQEMWSEINNHFFHVFLAHESHLTSSCGSGAMSPTLMGIISKGKEITEEHHAKVALLLAGAENIESADIALGAERIQNKLLKLPDVLTLFINVEPAQALAFLLSPQAGDAGEEYKKYIKRHAHRSISEMEIRQPEWGEDPFPLIRSLQIPLREKLQNPQAKHTTRTALDDAKVFFAEQNFLMKKLVKLAHLTVRNREETKSGMVKVTQIFKAAYRHLATLMVAEGLLPDTDAIYFLTHAELGELCQGKLTNNRGEDYDYVAVERRKVFPHQQSLGFRDIAIGYPEPVKADLSQFKGQKLLHGKPVSSGNAIGRARIVKTLDEAEHIKAGEILIAPITDIGWTPYFSLIAGLVTDIGSSLSHGAVVAREYGLPAIVKTDIGTQVFKTGELV